MPELDKVRFKGQILNTIPPTVFLLASPALTLERRKGELDQKSGLYSTDLVTSDYERRLKLCARYSKDILLTFSVTEVELDARVQTICHMILAGREGPSAGLLDKNAEPLRDLATKR